ncbi:MAG: membrane protein FxsA [Phycisphaerae bacterium]|nr:membrane protein FxsA [Phycisphaerae bacterium]NIV00307.1 membrane protein FxsA [Phycisphaerae bacterium]NIX30371.1 membrane protein FxsA [Phycisphaerae bacterium]
MFFKLLLLFTIIPIAELYLLIKIGGVIGALNTVLIIFLTAIVGASLAKSQGFWVLSKFQQAIRQGRSPAQEIIHGLFVLLGGFTLLTPGFITDFVGLTMLLPPIRAVYIRWAMRLIQNKIETGEWDIRKF